MAINTKRSPGGSPMPVKEFLDYALSVSEALGDIHKKDIIHGDIRPEYIRWEPDNLNSLSLQMGVAIFLFSARTDSLTFHLNKQAE